MNISQSALKRLDDFRIFRFSVTCELESSVGIYQKREAMLPTLISPVTGGSKSVCDKPPNNRDQCRYE